MRSPEKAFYCTRLNPLVSLRAKTLWALVKAKAVNVEIGSVGTRAIQKAYCLKKLFLFLSTYYLRYCSGRTTCSWAKIRASRYTYLIIRRKVARISSVFTVLSVIQILRNITCVIFSNINFCIIACYSFRLTIWNIEMAKRWAQRLARYFASIIY